MEPVREIPFTFRQLEVFNTVAHSDTLADAAAELLSSPSAISSAITELEKGLKVSLVERKRSKGVRLTSHGKLLLDLVRDLLENASDIAARVSEQHPETTGTIRIGVYTPMAAPLFPKLVSGFVDNYPQVNFEPHLGNQRELQELFDDGVLDVALTYDRFLVDGISFAKIDSRVPYALLHSDHPKAQQASISLKELEHDPFIVLDLHPSSENTLGWFEAEGVEPTIAWRINDAALARALVNEGLGYTILVQRQDGDIPDTVGHVVAVPIEPKPRELGVYIAWKTLPSGIPLRIQAFIDHVIDVMPL